MVKHEGREHAIEQALRVRKLVRESAIELNADLRAVRLAARAEQRFRIGVEPDDVDIVVITHFDFDHAGGNRFFPNADFVVQREQYAYAKATPQRCFAQDWGLPGLHYTLLDGDQELLPGIELLVTPGHAPGHQSVIVRGLPNTGTVILSSDAAHSHVEFEEERRDPNQDAETVEKMLASIRRLKRIRDAEGATLLLNHDADHWSTGYRLLPEYYD